MRRFAGEQIDGSLQHEGSTYLVEAKWHSRPADAAMLHSFQGKLLERADWTRGLYVSYGSFSGESFAAFTARHLIVMDGADIYHALNGGSILERLREKSPSSLGAAPALRPSHGPVPCLRLTDEAFCHRFELRGYPDCNLRDERPRRSAAPTCKVRRSCRFRRHSNGADRRREQGQDSRHGREGIRTNDPVVTKTLRLKFPGADIGSALLDDRFAAVEPSVRFRAA